MNARAAGQAGMQQAAAHAERVTPGFAAAAELFLRDYARTAVGPFAAEDVTDAARAAGLVPPANVAWGPVFRRVAEAGVIRRSTVVYWRRYGHGAPSLCWERR